MDITPEEITRIIYGVSRGEVVDFAIKLARDYTGRPKIIYARGTGVFWGTAAQQSEGPILELIKRNFKGYEIAMIFKRRAETIPKGYMETIGNTVNRPKGDSWIIYEIKPKKEIRIVIDFVKPRGLGVRRQHRLPRRWR